MNKKAKERNKEDVFLVEGIKMFLEAPRDRIKKVYISESLYEKGELNNALEGLEYELVDNHVFEALSDTKTPQGILCVIKQYHYKMDQLIGGDNLHLLIIENLQDPGNLGTMIRTGEGAGVTGVFISKSSVDIYNPKVIRSTMGSIYRMPFLYIEDMMFLMEELKKHRVTTYAAHLEGTGFYDQEDYRKDSAFLIGNEGNGLTKELADTADKYIKIPMSGKIESLNAAVAATVLMYEVYRQRR